jgi:hypothetical protein
MRRSGGSRTFYRSAVQPLREVFEGFTPFGVVSVIPQLGQLRLLPCYPFHGFHGELDILGGDLGPVAVTQSATFSGRSPAGLP